jgi:hypothetical protein
MGPVGPEQWLLRAPAGRSILYVTAILFIAVLLSGQRFGRPVPLAHEQVRRAPLEYITAIANLNRRAGHRTALMQRYHLDLKRHLGRRYRLDPQLPDQEYVARLARFNPQIDASALLKLLEKLNQRHFSETQVVELSREAASWMSTSPKH